MSAIRSQAASTLGEAGRTTSEAFLYELATPHHLARLLFNVPSLLLQPRGDGHGTIVLPGYGQSDKSTGVLRGYLKTLGYAVSGWLQGQNSGSLEAHYRELITLVRALHSETGKPVSLIGWSMGGVFAREVARAHPDLIRQVITMGSPIQGGPKYTVFAESMRQSGVDLDAVERNLHQRQQSLPEISVPVTALFSRSDGIVAWQACIDQHHDHVDHVEVSSSHMGFGYNADVFKVIARKLAAPLQ